MLCITVLKYLSRTGAFHSGTQSDQSRNCPAPSQFDLSAGELCRVPKRVGHPTSAEEEAHVLIIEPIGTRNTGNVEDPEFTAAGPYKAVVRKSKVTL